MIFKKISYLNYLLLIVLLIQISLLFFENGRCDEEGRVIEYVDVIIDSPLWDTNKDIIDKSKLIGVDLSFYTIDNTIYTLNYIKYNKLRNIIYHNINLKSYQSNNIYGITITHHSSDTAYIEYVANKHHYGMLLIHKKDGKWIELNHNLGKI